MPQHDDGRRLVPIQLLLDLDRRDAETLMLALIDDAEKAPLGHRGGMLHRLGPHYSAAVGVLLLAQLEARAGLPTVNAVLAEAERLLGSPGEPHA